MDDTELVQFEVTAERPRRKRGKLKLLLSLIPAALAVAAAVRRYRSSNAESANAESRTDEQNAADRELLADAGPYVDTLVIASSRRRPVRSDAGCPAARPAQHRCSQGPSTLTTCTA